MIHCRSLHACVVDRAQSCAVAGSIDWHQRRDRRRTYGGATAGARTVAARVPSTAQDPHHDRYRYRYPEPGRRRRDVGRAHRRHAQAALRAAAPRPGRRRRQRRADHPPARRRLRRAVPGRRPDRRRADVVARGRAPAERAHPDRRRDARERLRDRDLDRARIPLFDAGAIGERRRVARLRGPPRRDAAGAALSRAERQSAAPARPTICTRRSHGPRRRGAVASSSTRRAVRWARRWRRAFIS